MAKKSGKQIVEGSIKSLEKDISRLRIKEQKARERWTRGHKKSQKKTVELFRLKKLGTIKYQKLQEFLVSIWPKMDRELTAKRDEARKAIAKKELRLAELKNELNRIVEQEAASRRADDDLVNIIFDLNQEITDGYERMNKILTKRVYRLLVEDDGTLHSQVSIYSSDGLKKIVAMTNSITVVLPDLASEAMECIDSFFKSFEIKPELDNLTKALFELTRKLLIHLELRNSPSIA